MEDGSQLRLSVAGRPSKSLRVEVVARPETMRRGLSGRPQLPPRYGMLFVFPGEEVRSMWMPEMRFPLDILWLDSSMRIVHITRNATPCPSRANCPNYSSTKPAKYAIELTAGQGEFEPGMFFVVG